MSKENDEKNQSDSYVKCDVCGIKQISKENLIDEGYSYTTYLCFENVTKYTENPKPVTVCVTCYKLGACCKVHKNLALSGHSSDDDYD